MIEPEPLEFIGDNEVRWRGRNLTYFSGCDYFRLARHPRVAAAAAVTLKKSGLSVAASRMTTGNHEIYAQLERALAELFGVESSLLLPDGYFAPLAVAQALAGEFTHVFMDELAHGALQDAARMLGCPVKKFPHRDVPALKKLLEKIPTKAGRPVRLILLTDGMFAHDGSAAPLREYLRILPRNALILVDDAHGAGVLGATGRGAPELAGVGRRQIIQCATLSKAFGAYGGVVLGTRALRQSILDRSRSFMGTTPLPLPLAGAALASLAIWRAEPARRVRLFRNVAYTRKRLRAAGWTISETPGPIIRLPAMSDPMGEALKERLLAAGIYPPYLKYGGISAQGIFRLVISSEHRRAQLDRLISELAEFKKVMSGE